MKTLLLFSGGLDSCVGLEKLIEEGVDIMLVGYVYGQKNDLEIELASNVATIKGMELLLLDLTEFFQDAKSPLITQGHIGEDAFVRNRNLVFLMKAHELAMDNGCDRVAFCITNGEDSYPDATFKFMRNAERLLNNINDTKIEFFSPVMSMTNESELRYLDGLGKLNFYLDNSISCYEGVPISNKWGIGCGRCVRCSDRIQSFNNYEKSIVKDDSTP